MEEKYREFVFSTDYSEQYSLIQPELNMLIGFLHSLSDEEMQRLLRYKEVQKVVDVALSSL